MTKTEGERDIPVTQIELKYGISAGIHLRALANGMVTLQEEHGTRLERGISLQAWADMPEMEKALAIAQRRNATAIHNLYSEAEIDKAKRDAKRSGKN